MANIIREIPYIHTKCGNEMEKICEANSSNIIIRCNNCLENPKPMNNTQNWEEIFDKKFPSVESWSQRKGDYTETPIPHLKAFIHSLLAQKDAEKEKMMREVIEAIGRIEVPEVFTDFNDGGDPEYRNRRIAVDSARVNGFNKALQYTLSALNKLAEKYNIKLK